MNARRFKPCRFDMYMPPRGEYYTCGSLQSTVGSLEFQSTVGSSVGSFQSISCQHVNFTTRSAGCMPSPDFTVCVLPRLSVTVSVTLRSLCAPVALASGAPQASVIV